MRCDVATIERHLLALAGNWLAALGCTASTVGLCQIKAFQAQQSIKVVVVAVLFLAFGCWLRARVSQPGPNKLPSSPLSLPSLPSCLLCLGLPHFPWLIYSNVDAWRCLSTLFICICIFFLLPFLPFFSLFPSLCSFFVA